MLHLWPRYLVVFAAALSDSGQSGSDWHQMGQIHLVVSQNVLKSDLKNPRFVPFGANLTYFRLQSDMCADLLRIGIYIYKEKNSEMKFELIDVDFVLLLKSSFIIIINKEMEIKWKVKLHIYPTSCSTQLSPGLNHKFSSSTLHTIHTAVKSNPVI